MAGPGASKKGRCRWSRCTMCRKSARTSGKRSGCRGSARSGFPARIVAAPDAMTVRSQPQPFGGHGQGTEVVRSDSGRSGNGRWRLVPGKAPHAVVGGHQDAFAVGQDVVDPGPVCRRRDENWRISHWRRRPRRFRCRSTPGCGRPRPGPGRGPCRRPVRRAFPGGDFASAKGRRP